MEDLLRGDEPDAITFERIHGRSSSSMIQARDLDLHTFAPRDFPPQSRANGVAGQVDLPAEPERVLLTGANGFLGRFLLLDFLKPRLHQVSTCTLTSQACQHLTPL